MYFQFPCVEIDLLINSKSAQSVSTSRLSSGWDMDLDVYVSSPGERGTPDAIQTIRAKLAAEVRAAHECPEVWWAFLRHEEDTLSIGNNAELIFNRPSRNGIPLFELYRWATRLIPRQGNYTKESFIRIWVGFGRQQWFRNQDDGRDTFKTLKSQHIGDGCVALYAEWAALELRSGDVYKALSIISKGGKDGGQPSPTLDSMAVDIRNGTYMYRPFWLQPAWEDAEQHHDNIPKFMKNTISGTSTSHVNFRTPGVADEHPLRAAISHTTTAKNTLTDNLNRTVYSGSSKSGSGDPTSTMKSLKTPGMSLGSGSSGSGSISEEATVAIRISEPKQRKLAEETLLIVNRASTLSLTSEKPLLVPRKSSGTSKAFGGGRALRVTPPVDPPPPVAAPVAEEAAEEDRYSRPPTLPAIPEQQIVAPSAEQPLSMPHPLIKAPMGPPPPRPTSARPGRRVVEDENSVIVKGIAYTKLECVGKGGSSKVFKVMAPNRKIFALKRIRLSGRDVEAATGFLDEINLLSRLKGAPNIIQLIDAEVHQNEGLIYMVLECGDIDLARLLQRHEKSRRDRAAAAGVDPQSLDIDENFVRLYWEQMLHAVDIIHRQRIVHSDLKPANFLMVEGQLKLIDFGIAKAIQSDTTSIARESQVGTLNYMSPEAILGGANNIRGGPAMKVGRPSDIWSLGCILYQMAYGATPFAHLPFIQKMHAITDSNHSIHFPPLRNAALLDVIRKCLDRDPKTRITMIELLAHPFLRPSNASALAAGPVTPLGDHSNESVAVSKDQLRKLLAKMQNSQRLDVEQLLNQLSIGAVDI